MAALGAVTYAANHVAVTTVGDDGKAQTTFKRDADRYQARPSHVAARPWRTRTPASPPPVKPLAAEPTAPVNPRRRAVVEAQARARTTRHQHAALRDARVRDVLAERAARRPLRSPSPGVARRLAASLAADHAAARDRSEAASASADLGATPLLRAIGAATALQPTVATDATDASHALCTLRRQRALAVSSVARSRTRTPAPSPSLCDLIRMHDRAYRPGSHPRVVSARGLLVAPCALHGLRHP